nr:acyltransferase family protein [Azoarcus olearius]
MRTEAVAAVPPQPGAPRDAGIDAARAIGIVLVVIGHARGCPPWLSMLLYSFHVPLFFWLAGAVVSEARLFEPAGRTVARLARRLLGPYLFFFTAAYLYWLATRGIGEKAARWGDRPWWEPLQGLATGQGELLYVDPALWFLPALFVTAGTYAALYRRFSAATIAGGALVFALAWCVFFPDSGSRMPFALDVLPAALVFYACGHWMYPYLRACGRVPRRVVVLVAAAWLALAFANGRVDLNQLRFGEAVLLYFAAAGAGILMVLLLAPYVRSNRLTDWLAASTLLIFASHMVTFNVLSGLAAVAGWQSARDGFGWALASSVVAILVCKPLGSLLEAGRQRMLRPLSRATRASVGAG